MFREAREQGAPPKRRWSADMAKRNRQSTSRAQGSTAVRVDAVETGVIRLTDKAGRVRAVLEMGPAGPRLAMMHEDGTVAFELALANDGPSARFADVKGGTRVFVGANRGSARFGMADGAGSQRLYIGVGGGGRPVVSFYDQQQKQTWTAGTRAKGPGTESPSQRVRAPRKKPLLMEPRPPA